MIWHYILVSSVSIWVFRQIYKNHSSNGRFFSQLILFYHLYFTFSNFSSRWSHFSTLWMSGLKCFRERTTSLLWRRQILLDQPPLTSLIENLFAFISLGIVAQLYSPMFFSSMKSFYWESVTDWYPYGLI